MTQRNNADDKRLHNSWQRSLPVQSLCWLGSFSFLSSGLVFAQTESSIDNIVPTVENTQPSAGNSVKKDIVIQQSASTPDFSQRRAKLQQRLRKADVSQARERIRTQRQIEASEPAKPSIRSKPQVENATSKPQVKVSLPPATVRSLRAKVQASQRQTPALQTEEKPIQLATPEKIIQLAQPSNNNSASTGTASKPKDYNNAYIDPTDYNTDATGNYQAPNSVVITERGSSCRTILAQGGSGSGCVKAPIAESLKRRLANTDNQKDPKGVASWLRKSQHVNLANVPPVRLRVNAKGDNSERNIERVAAKGDNSERTTQRVVANRNNSERVTQRVAANRDNSERVTQRVLAHRNNSGWRPSRISSIGVTKNTYRPQRYIPNNFSPTTTVSSVPYAPHGGSLPAPMTSENAAPRASTVAYNIPLATALPQIAYGGGGSRYAYGNGTGMLFPLSVPAPITSLFGWRVHPITGDRRFHSGTDIGAAMGTPVLAASTGQVEIADYVGGYGLTVVMNHTSAQQTLYGHMSEVFVQPGQWVEQGTVIGRVGNTGNSTGPHLHFEVRQLTPEGWVATDPGVQLQSAVNQLVQVLQTAQVTQQPGS